MTLRLAPFLVTLVLLAACGQTGPPNLPGASATLGVGKSEPYNLYTHCGILSVTINGTVFYAQPQLSDGSGNPPMGWGNPGDEGTLTLTSATTADFIDPAGHHAHFTSTPAGPTPSIPICM